MTEEKANNETKAAEQKNTQEGIKDNKLCAILAYVLLGIVWYFLDSDLKKDEYVKFHVKQAIVVLSFSLAGSIILGMTMILAWLIPFYQLAILALVIIGIYNAYNDAKKELPVIGKFADKIKI